MLGEVALVVCSDNLEAGVSEGYGEGTTEVGVGTPCPHLISSLILYHGSADR
jgi:hypothetical protein